MLKNCIYIFLISMVPVVELRGSIPIGIGLGVPVWLTFLVAIAGNCLPVPLILLFMRGLLRWMKKVRYLDRFALWLEKKAHKCSVRVLKYASFGLFFFVAVPLPGTGAWTGALVASVLDMRMKYALPSIICGVLCAGVIITLICSGVLGALAFLL